MSSEERYGTRDLSYSAWHRKQGYDLPYIDIDGVEYCRACNEPLALIETAQDVGQKRKATTVTCRLAERAGLPAYLVFYSPGDHAKVTKFRVAQVWPTREEPRVMTVMRYKAMLRELRAEHTCNGAPVKRVTVRAISKETD